VKFIYIRRKQGLAFKNTLSAPEFDLEPLFGVVVKAFATSTKLSYIEPG